MPFCPNSNKMELRVRLKSRVGPMRIYCRASNGILEFNL